MKKTKLYFTWHQFDNAVKQLEKQLHPTLHEYDSIYGIPRGGLPLAVALSHKLDLSLVFKPTLKTLIVDDISDEGNALAPYINTHTCVTIVSTEWTKSVPKFWVYEKLSKEGWIVFPWEQTNSEVFYKNMKGGIIG